MKKSKTEISIKKKKKRISKSVKAINKTLDWIDIDEVHENYISLKRSSKTEHVVGFKIDPPNMFLEDETIQSRWINALRTVFNRIDAEIYQAFVYSPINLDTHLAAYHTKLQYETDPVIIDMINTEIQLWSDYSSYNFELEFFIMLKGKESKNFTKKYLMLAREFQRNGFIITPLNYIDFNNLIAYTFNNQMINDFYFSRGVFVDKILLDSEIQRKEEYDHEPIY